MKGPIYDYDNQEWTEIDTDTDKLIDPFPMQFITPCGVKYELNPNNHTEYRNL